MCANGVCKLFRKLSGSIVEVKTIKVIMNQKLCKHVNYFTNFFKECSRCAYCSNNKGRQESCEKSFLKNICFFRSFAKSQQLFI